MCLKWPHVLLFLFFVSHVSVTEALFNLFSSFITSNDEKSVETNSNDTFDDNLYNCEPVKNSKLCSKNCEASITPILATCTALAAFTRPFFLTLTSGSESILDAFGAATLAALSPLCESEAPNPCIYCREEPCLRGLFHKVDKLVDSWRGEMKEAKADFEENIKFRDEKMENAIQRSQIELKLDAIYGEAWSAFHTLDVLYKVVEDGGSIGLMESTMLSLTSSPRHSFFNLHTLSHTIASMIRDPDYSYLALNTLDSKECSNEEMRALLTPLLLSQMRVYEMRSFVAMRQGKSEIEVKRSLAKSLAKEMRRQGKYVNQFCRGENGSDHVDNMTSMENDFHVLNNGPVNNMVNISSPLTL